MEPESQPIEGGFGEAWWSKDFSDLSLVTSGGKRLRVHRILLIRSNHYFKSKILENPEVDSIVVEDPFDCIEDVLHFLYTGYIDILPTTSENLLQASEYYGIQELTNFCMELIRLKFGNENQLIFLYLNHGEQTRRACLDYITSNFSDLQKKGSFLNCKIEHLTPKNLYDIISSDELVVSNESVVVAAIMEYLIKNRSSLGETDISLLLSGIRFSQLPANSLISLLKYQDLLPSSWIESLLTLLCKNSDIKPPTFKHAAPRKRAYSGPEIEFSQYSPNITILPSSSVALPESVSPTQYTVVSKTQGSWWSNILSSEPLKTGLIHRIFFAIISCGGGYVGVGLGAEAYKSEDSFLGQRADGWCLCTSAGYEWDGHVFNNITTNTGKAYADRLKVGTGSIIEMIVDLTQEVGSVEWAVNGESFGVAYSNINVPVHVVVSMFLTGSVVAVWKNQ